MQQNLFSEDNFMPKHIQDILIEYNRLLQILWFVLLFPVNIVLVQGQDISEQQRYEKFESLVTKTHKKSSDLRMKLLNETVNAKNIWPKGYWGEILRGLSALYLNKEVDKTNELLLKGAKTYIDSEKLNQNNHQFKPETSEYFPWHYFGLNDYTRILYLFGKDSDRYPGRLSLQTESTMKKALWYFIKKESRVEDASLDKLLVLMGTENHDLTQRSNYYLLNVLFSRDPEYKDRQYNDGHTALEHVKAYETFYREWPVRRVKSGLWFEVGSDTYQKYSYPALFNLSDLSPDPIIRKRFKIYLDLCFIEEAQISVHGRRGGGRSRASYGQNSFEAAKHLLYGNEDGLRGTYLSKVIETSAYQVPDAAIALRRCEFPTEEPFLIQNRVLGEFSDEQIKKGGEYHKNYFSEDSSLVNYAWRSPYYVLGSTQQDPSLTMKNPDSKYPVVKYGGLSTQKRWCGLLLQSESFQNISAVYPYIEQTRGGRPKHSFYSVQYKNVLYLQRIAPQTKQRIGSYSTGVLGIKFSKSLAKVIEKESWFLIDFGKVYVAIKFLDGKYHWNKEEQVLYPVDFEPKESKTRILIHVEDKNNYATFDAFYGDLFKNELKVHPNKVEYRFNKMSDQMEIDLLDYDSLDKFSLPVINGKILNLKPEKVYDSPYLKGNFGEAQVSIQVGPVKKTLDFQSN